MELRQLEYFSAVARHLHFRRAAEEVYVTQSALSQQIKRLEAELGVALFTRTTKGVELTPAGADLARHAESIFKGVAEAHAVIDEHRGALRGVARVAATVADSRGLPEALLEFHRRHPGIQIALRHVSAGEVDELLANGVVDVGIVGRYGERTDGEPASPAEHTIAEEPLCIVCAEDHPLADRRQVTIDELRGAPVILPGRGTALREAIMAECARAGFSPVPLFEVSDPPTIRYLVHSGLGLSVVPSSWVQDAGPRVGVARFAPPAPRHRVALLTPTAVRLPAGRLLVDHLASHFGARHSSG